MTTTSGLDALGDLDRLGAVPGLTNDLDVRLSLEDHPEACPHQRLIVGDDHPDAAHPAPLFRRQHRPQQVAAPGAVPARSEPPNSAVRSRIPISPCRPGVGARGARAVVADPQLERVRQVAHEHVGSRPRRRA